MAVRKESTMVRPVVNARAMAFLLALYVTGLLNLSAWRLAGDIFQTTPGDAWRLMAALFLVHAALFLSLTFPWLFKPVAAVLVTGAAVASHFMDGFGTVIDKDMIVNAATTTHTEAKHLLTPDFALHLLLYALVPIALMFWTRRKRTRFWRDVAINVPLILAMLAMAGGLIFSDYAAFASAFRERKDLVFSLNPIGPGYAIVKYAKQALGKGEIVVQPIGVDAHAGPFLAASGKPVFLVLVVGETLRSQDFGLEGYERQTTPELARIDPLYFPATTSCGTATAVSMPCMFSMYGRDTYSDLRGLDHENLLDVLHRAGFDVEWWDNNTGDKDIAARLPSRLLTHSADPAHCDEDECNDGIFLARLRDRMATAQRNTVIVLHLIGSHGPAYFKRYPQAFETFRPACRSAQFSDCTAQEIRNAYDNSVLYTDHVLAQIIAMEQAQSDRLAAGLVFASDHGESLGENGLYLHGAPYFIAPETQTHVPFLAWFSPSFSQELGLANDCLRGKTRTPASHDNFFHSVLGAVDVRTDVRDAKLDLFGTCRKETPPVHAASARLPGAVAAR